MTALALFALLLWEPWKTYEDLRDEPTRRLVVRTVAWLACIALIVIEGMTYLEAAI